MANNPFDREVINQLERPLSSDANKAYSYVDQQVREVLYELLASRVGLGSDAARYLPAAGGAGFIGAAFKARGVTGALKIALDPGLGFFNDNINSAFAVGGVPGVDDLSFIKPLSLTLPETINIPAADPTNGRIDIIEVQFDRRLADPTSRDVLVPSTGAFTPSVVNKTLTYNQNGRSTVNGAGSINYKAGTPGASPLPPTTDAGYAVIAQVFVPPLATALGPTCVMDLRQMLFPAGQGQIRATMVNGTLKINALSLPPGMEAAVIADPQVAVFPPVSALYIKMGGVVPSNVNAFIVNAVAAGNPGATAPTVIPQIRGVTAFGGGGGSPALELGLLSATPPMVVMPGQPLLKLNSFFGATLAGASGQISTAYIDFQY